MTREEILRVVDAWARAVAACDVATLQQLATPALREPVVARTRGIHAAFKDVEVAAQHVVVEGDAVELARRLGGQIQAYGRFGTCTVRVRDMVYDLAASRRERYAEPGALPEVEPAPLSEDLRRRDFTVNALAVALTGARTGSLVAPEGALGDLEAGRLRVFHERSFLDDPTRLLRLARYAARLAFAPSCRCTCLDKRATWTGWVRWRVNIRSPSLKTRRRR